MVAAKKLTKIEADEIIPYGADDDQIATRIAEDWNNKAAYFHSRWHVYERGLWVEHDDQKMRRDVRMFLRPHRKKLKGGVSQGRVQSVLKMLEDDRAISDREIIQLEGASLPYVNLQNGLFNLETFQLEPHRADLFMTTQLGFAYDPEARCDTFKHYLRTSLACENGELDLDMVMLAQEALAYALTARTDFKASFWLIGKPDTGKSTLTNLIHELLGNLQTTIDLNQLASNRFLLSGIVGKRAVTFTEAESNSFLPDALYKAMTGGRDAIYVDVKNRPGFDFIPIAKFFWAMNKPPRINDRSGATLNRLLPILFEHEIKPDERIGNLDALLKAERSGIFNFLLLGWRRLTNTGRFTMPRRSLDWRENFKQENDTEFVYASERLSFASNEVINAQILFDDYRAWCERNGFRPKNLNQIGAEWRRLGLVQYKSNGRHWYRGAKLVEK